MAQSMRYGAERCQLTSWLDDIELMLNLPQPASAVAQQIPTYAANAVRRFQPVLYLRTFGLFMMFLTNKAFKFLISQIDPDLIPQGPSLRSCSEAPHSYATCVRRSQGLAKQGR